MQSVRRLTGAAGAFVIFAALVAPAAAQDIAEGTWSGSIRTPPPRNANPRPSSLVVEKGPDPHWRWRGGANEITTITFTAGPLTAPVSEIELADGRMTFSLNSGGPEAGSCELSEQPDGRYEGSCLRVFNGVLISLSPPEENVPDEEQPTADQ